MKALVARAEPTRDFFVSMLTRDISLADCILDLIDNSIDGAHRGIGNAAIDDPSDRAYRNFGCEVKLSRATFEISDNCGGIPLDIAQNYAFRFGRAAKAPKDKYGVGIYGIGMKRAIFKLGRKAQVHSRTKTHAFYVDIDVEAWLRQGDAEWSFPIRMEKTTKSFGTRIVVSDLVPATELASHDFLRSLDRILGRDYAFFIQRGFTITLNGKKVEPASFEMQEGGEFEPMRTKYKDTTGVNVEIVAGMASVPPDDDTAGRSRASRDMELFGWYVLCNERTILAADKSERTVWGYSGTPEWHNQYSGFKGFVFFRSADPGSLPWTTTKRDIDLSSDVYRRALTRMRAVTKTWTTYTNRRKVNIDRAKVAERETKSVPVLQLPKRMQMKLPKLQSTGPTMVNILYQERLIRVDRVRKALGDENLSQRDVGLQTFDYFYKREVDG